MKKMHERKNVGKIILSPLKEPEPEPEPIPKVKGAAEPAKEAVCKHLLYDISVNLMWTNIYTALTVKLCGSLTIQLKKTFNQPCGWGREGRVGNSVKITGNRKGAYLFNNFFAGGGWVGGKKCANQ